jgi:hypothetical protein
MIETVHEVMSTDLREAIVAVIIAKDIVVIQRDRGI